MTKNRFSLSWKLHQNLTTNGSLDSAAPLQHSLLRKRMLQLLMRQDMSFGDSLQPKQIRSLLVSHQQHFSSTTFPQHTHHLEIINDDFSLRFLGFFKHNHG